MRTRSPLLVLFAWMLLLALLPGCGGGGGNNDSQALTRGTVMINIQFPQMRAQTSRALTQQATALLAAHSNTRQQGTASGFAPGTRVNGVNLPYGTNAVKVTVLSLTTNAPLADPKIVTPPTSGFGTSTSASFPSLPPGLIKVVATAHSDAGATSAPLATGSVTGQITPNITTNLVVPLELTATAIAVTPPMVSVPLGTTATSTASVTDASNNALVTPFLWNSDNISIAKVTFDPTHPATATIQPIRAGTTTITVVEPNSGLTTQVAVTVTPEPGVVLTGLAALLVSGAVYRRSRKRVRKSAS